MAQKSKRNLAADTSFRKNYASLHSALAQPNVTSGLASKLYERAIIAAETRDAVQFTSGITPLDRAASLLRAVESSIKMDYRRFRKFVRILRDNPTLKPTALRLHQCYRTLVAEAGQMESCSSESDTDLEGTEQDTKVNETDQFTKINTVSVAQRIEEFESRFKCLTYDAEVEIREKHTPVKLFRHTVVQLPLSIRADHYQFLKENLLKLEKAESIDEIFMYLNLYWSFIDCNLLEYIIREHGSDDLKAKMETYVQDLAQFKRTTTIHQVCGLAKRWGSRPDLPQHFALLSTKFKKDPSQYTLEELECFRISFCREFSLSESAAMIAGAAESSLVILWHVPSSLVPDLTAAILSHPHSNSFFEQQSLLLLELDGKCLYHAPASTSAFKEEVHKASVGAVSEQSSQLSKIPTLNEDEEALLKACDDGKLEEVTRLIEIGVNVNVFKPQVGDTDTPLMAASWNGNLQIVQLLLRCGALVNFQDLDDFTALIFASQEGHHHIVLELLKAEADVNAQNKNRDTALTLASYKGHESIVRDLLKSGADPNLQTKRGSTALMFTAEKGHDTIVIQLLKAGADPNLQTEDKATALTFAAQNGHDAIVHELLTAGADPDLQTENGDTSLMEAANEGHVSIARDLLQAKADPNIQNVHGSTALSYASEKGHESIVRDLLMSGANPNIQTKHGETALHVASRKGQVDCAVELLKTGLDVNRCDEDGDTALFQASFLGYTEIVQELLKAKANVNLLNKNGLTPLLAATQNNHTDIVQKLLDAGADINIAEENTGWTALFFAAKVGEVEMIQLLLQKGADLRHVDRENVTAMDVARAHGQKRVCQILQESQRSCLGEQHTEETNIGGIDRSQDEQQTEDTDVGARDEHLTEETNVGGMKKSPQSDHRQQALKERVLRASNYFKTLFKRLEENLLRSKTEKAKAIEDFQSVHSPRSQSSKRVKKGKKQSVKKTANTGEVKIY